MKTAEELIKDNPILRNITIEGNDRYSGGVIEKAIEDVMQEYVTQCQQDNAERRYTDEDMIDFLEFTIQNAVKFRKLNEVEILQLWKEQRVKTN